MRMVFEDSGELIGEFYRAFGAGDRMAMRDYVDGLIGEAIETDNLTWAIEGLALARVCAAADLHHGDVTGVRLLPEYLGRVCENMEDNADLQSLKQSFLTERDGTDTFLRSAA